MNTYKKQELIDSKVHGLTMKDLRDFVYKNSQILNTAKILVERIEDKYFIGDRGWEVLLKEGEIYNNAIIVNRELEKESGYKDCLTVLDDDLKEQFFPAWCITKDKDDSFVYIYNHY